LRCGGSFFGSPLSTVVLTKEIFDLSVFEHPFKIADTLGVPGNLGQREESS
jgi:hypothetical protein